MQSLKSRRGGIISGLLFAGILVFAAILAAAIIITKTVRVRTIDGRDGADVSIATPAGRLDINARDHMNPALTGIPVYPGAYREKDGGANIEWNSKNGDTDKDLSIIGGEFRTRDSVSQVVEFYRQQLPRFTIVSEPSENDRSTRLEFREGTLRRIVSIHRQGGETRIGVASIGGRASN